MKRHWFQFRLRTLFLLLTLAAIATGVIQHFRYVSERIQFHEAKMANIGQQIAVTTGVGWLRSRVMFSRMVPDSQPFDYPEANPTLPSGHLLHFGQFSKTQSSPGNPTTQEAPNPRRNPLYLIFEERRREVARFEVAKDYHHKQLELFRQAMWRPWMRVIEDPSQELSETPPEIMRQITAPNQQPSLPATPEQQIGPKPALNPSAPTTFPRAKEPWQSIDRPLPRDFENHDVQEERASAA